MNGGLIVMEHPLLCSFLPFLSSFFDFGRPIFNFFPESAQFQSPFNPLTIGISFLFKRFYGFFESFLEASWPRIPLMVKIIPQQFTRVLGNYIGKHPES